MTNVIEFDRKTDFKVLFTLPTGKVLQLNKTAEDDFDIEINGGNGVAYISANGKHVAESRLQRVFPSAEIIETTVI